MGACVTFFALLALGLLLNYLVHLSRAQILTADDASITMRQKHQNEEVPEQIRGVLWMRGNTCPELLLTLEAGAYDRTSRTILLTFGAGYSWSYSSDSAGWREYAAVTANLAFFSPGMLRVEFEEDFRFARMQVTIAGISAANAVGLWAINQTDDLGGFWDRLMWDDSGSKWRFVYDIKKVLDSNGTKLPAWSQIVNSTISGAVVHGEGCGCDSVVKTYEQLLHGDFSTLQIFLSILSGIIWLSLAMYCVNRSNTKAPSPEFEPLARQP